MKTNSKEFRKKVENYILENVDSSGYGITCETKKDSLLFVSKCFVNEFWYNSNKKRYNGNKYTGFAEYLKGLPSCITIDFENYRILEIAKEWGSYKETSGMTDKAIDRYEERIISNWWNLISINFWRMVEQQKFNLN